MTAEEIARRELSEDERRFAEAFNMTAVDYLASRNADPSRSVAERVKAAVIEEGD